MVECSPQQHHKAYFTWTKL